MTNQPDACFFCVDRHYPPFSNVPMHCEQLFRSRRVAMFHQRVEDVAEQAVAGTKADENDANDMHPVLYWHSLRT